MTNELTIHDAKEIRIISSKDRLSEDEPYYSIDKILIKDTEGSTFTINVFGSLTDGFTNIKLEEIRDD